MNKNLIISWLIPIYFTTMTSIGYTNRSVSGSNKLLSNISICENDYTIHNNKFNNVPKEYMDKEVENLKSKVILENDIRLFTLYAFMNYTGYNDENRQSGFSEVRQLVRNELREKNIELSDGNYYNNKAVEDFYYVQALKFIGSEPNFQYICPVPNYLSMLDDLPERLQEFYNKADILTLYKKYNSYYEKEINKYFDMYEALTKMNYYLKVNTNNVQKFYVNPNLLDAYWRGNGLGSIDYYKGTGAIIAGPCDEANIVLIVHEYLHGVITPITKSLREEIDRTSYKMGEISEKTQAKSSSYNRWQSIVDECIIRGISHKVANNISSENYLKNTMDDGFILAKYFSDSFDEFENYNGSLESFIKMLIERIK